MTLGSGSASDHAGATLAIELGSASTGRDGHGGTQRGSRSVPKAPHRGSARGVHSALVAQSSGELKRAAPGAQVSTAAVRCICPPRPDGGTSLKLTGAQLSPKILDAIALARTLKRGDVITLATPAGGTMDLEVGDRRGDRLDLHADGRAIVRVHASRGIVVLIARATQLWQDGVERWLRQWVPLVTWWVTGHVLDSSSVGLLDDAHELGWRLYELELAADFTGFELDVGDHARFLVPGRGNGQALRTDGCPIDGKEETVCVGKTGRVRDGLGMSCHNKTLQLSRRRIAPVKSVYAPTWERWGWAGEEVRRVEMRFHGRTLRLRAKSCDASLDASHPRALLDGRVLGQLWRHATHRIRLTLGNHKRLRSSTTDERWVMVQNAVPPSDDMSWTRQPRARQLTRDDWFRRTLKASMRNFAALITLTGWSPESAAARVFVQPGFPDEMCKARARFAWLTDHVEHPEPTTRADCEPRGRQLW